MAFKTSDLKCLKPLVAYVPKYHWGIRETCNIPLQLSKWKQGSAIRGVVERECIEFMRERPSMEPLVQIQCIVLGHVFIRIPLRVCMYISTYYYFCFCQLRSENKELKYFSPDVYVL